MKYDIKEREWIASGLTSGRPVDPEGVARFIRSLEMERVERLRSRHHEFDREPRMYSDGSDDVGYAG